MNGVVKKIIIAILIAALVCGGIYGGLVFYKRSRSAKVSVYPVSEVIVPSEYFFDESQSYGSVAADRIQSVFITGTQNVKEVLVKEGQQVKKGDPLISYDTTLTAIQLEKAENDLAQQELALSNSRRDLERLEQLRPSSDSEDGEDFGFFPEDFDEEEESRPEGEDEEEEVTYQPQPTGVRIGGKGTAEDPYIYLWSVQDALTNEQLLAMFTSDGRIHYVGTAGGGEELTAPAEAFIAGIGRSLGLLPLSVFGEDVIEEVIEEDGFTEDEEILAEELFSDPDPEEEIVEEAVEAGEEDLVIEDTPEEEAGADDGGGTSWVEVPSEEDPQEILSPESTPSQEEAADPYAWLDDCPNEVYVILEMHKYDNARAPIELRYGMHLIRVGHEVAARLFNPDPVSSGEEESGDDGEEGDDDYTPIDGEEDLDDFGDFDDFDFDYGDDYDYGDEEEEEDGVPSLNESSIDFDAHYTAKEIEEMKREKAREVRDDTISYRMSEINLRDMRKEMADGFVRSSINGVIKTVRQPDEAYKNSEAVVVVSGGGGYSVSISVSELELGTLTKGQEVEVSSFSNEDVVFDGTIDSLGDYPAASLDGWSTGNPNVSYYPCKVNVSEDAELREGDYVSVKYTGNAEEQKASYYIEAMYVRHDSSGRYVYVEGKDGRLERRNIVTGKAPDSYTVEIRGGLSPDDQIAFPYGGNIKEGAVVEHASIDELY